MLVNRHGGHPLSQGAVLTIDEDGAYVQLPIEGVEDGELLAAEVAAHGLVVVPEDVEPWEYTDQGVFIFCDPL